LSPLDQAREQQGQMPGHYQQHRSINGLAHARNLQARSSADVYKINQQGVSRSSTEHEPWVEAGSNNKNNFRIPRKKNPPPNNNTKNQPIDLCDGDNSQTEPERSRGSSLDTASSHDSSHNRPDDSHHNTSTSTVAAAAAKKRVPTNSSGGEDLVDSDDDVAVGKRKKRPSPDSDDRKVAAKSHKKAKTASPVVMEIDEPDGDGDDGQQVQNVVSMIENGESHVDQLEVRNNYGLSSGAGGVGGTRGFYSPTIHLGASVRQKGKGHYGGIAQRRAGKKIQPGNSLTSVNNAVKKKPTAAAAGRERTLQDILVERDAEKKKNSKQKAAGTFVVGCCTCASFFVCALEFARLTLYYTHARFTLYRRLFRRRFVPTTRTEENDSIQVSGSGGRKEKRGD